MSKPREQSSVAMDKPCVIEYVLTIRVVHLVLVRPRSPSQDPKTIVSEPGVSYIDVAHAHSKVYFDAMAPRKQPVVSVNPLMWTRTSVRKHGAYQTVCLWPGTSIRPGEVPDFVDFICKEFETVHPIEVIGNVKTRAGHGGPGGRLDLLFLVHDDDVMKFANSKRSELGIRWWSDVHFNDQHDLYSKDLLHAFPFQGTI